MKHTHYRVASTVVRDGMTIETHESWETDVAPEDEVHGAPLSLLRSEMDGSFTVDFDWSNLVTVDRPHTFGIAVTTRRDADRVMACNAAGKFFRDAHVATDNFGHTYVAAHSNVYGRHLNADLKAQGF